MLMLQDLMCRALTYEDSVRWGRCLTETMKIASTVCPASAAEAYVEIVNRLHVRLAFATFLHLARPHLVYKHSAV